MGIPHLAQLLQPFATSTILGCKTLGCRKHKLNSDGDQRLTVIIDGPALAFHVYHRILGQKPSALNAFDATPSYSEVAYPFLEYVEELKSYNIRVDNIYFDGCLPTHKRETRLKRLEAIRRELLNFRAKHPDGVTLSKEAHEHAQTTATTAQLLDKSVSPLPS